jgi:hypothetical protein
MAKTLTVERARELFEYDPESGILRRKLALGKAKIGVPVGYLAGNGYLYVSADNQKYLVHRVAFLIVNGRWPDEIDHADLNRLNNKWSNLREATMAQNMANRRAHRDSQSGRKGVTFHSPTNKWRAVIHNAGRNIHLGLFDDIAMAEAAYFKMAQEIHGEFARAQ